MSTQPLWLQFFSFLFFWGGVAAFIVGLLLVLAPSLVLRVAAALDRWISTERVFRDLEAPRTSERLFYRHHRVFGALLALGAIYLLYSFGFTIEADALARRAPLFGSRTAAEWLYQSLAVLNLIFGLVALGLGIAVFFRPSVLKRIESATNRWFAVDDSIKRRMDERVSGPDRWLAARPRLMGVLVMMGGLYVVFSLYSFVRW